MEKIDAHHHCWRYNAEQHAWIDDSMQAIRKDFCPEDLQPCIDENEITGTVLVQVDQTHEENHFMLSLAQTSTFIKGLVGWIDLLAPDLHDQLAMWTEEPHMKGFRHIAQAEAHDFLARPDIIKGIGALHKYGFTYDILIKPPQMEAALQLVAALPDQPFVIDHLAKPYIAAGALAPWKQHIRQLAQHKNVYCKISGMVTEADWKHWTYAQMEPYMEVVWEAFGAHRVMFGSDWPVCLVAASYNGVVSAAARFVSTCSATEQAAFWGGNARRFYRL